MRNRKTIVWIAGLTLALAAQVLTAQQPGAAVRPPYPTNQWQEPRQFPGAAQPEPLPIRRGPGPVDVRLVGAEEPLPAQNSKPPLKLAPRSEARNKTSARPTAPTASSAAVTVAVSLAIVLGVFVIAVWFSGKFSPSGTSLLPKEAVEMLGRTPLTARQQAHLVRVGNKLLLVAISPVGAETLTEITEPADVERLTSMCRRGKPDSSTVAFRQALTQLGQEPAPRGFVGSLRTTSRGDA